MLKIDEDIPFINKPWGYERIFAQTDTYVGKYIFIQAGEKLSRQYHQLKDETVYVLSGPFHLEIGPSPENEEIVTLSMHAGEAYHVQSGAIHRFCAPPDNDVELIEVSTPELEDVVRLEDKYNRILGIEA